jgi:HEAT repeat protein
MLREVLTAQPERANALLPKLRLYHPAEISRRVAAAYDASSEPRAQKRAVWLAGELGGPDALPFLLRCASSSVADVRAIAASAIGKALDALLTDGGKFAANLAKAKDALRLLSKDPAPQVSAGARKALSRFPQ